jgi:hypothetical protein
VEYDVEYELRFKRLPRNGFTGSNRATGEVSSAFLQILMVIRHLLTRAIFIIEEENVELGQAAGPETVSLLFYSSEVLRLTSKM